MDHVEEAARSFEAAVALAEEGRTAEALDAFAAVVERCADVPDLQALAVQSLDWQAYLLLEAGRDAEALAVADAQIARGGERRSSVSGHRRRAYALARLGRRDESIATLREALVRFADVADPLVRAELVAVKAALARDLIEVGHYDQALIALDAYLDDEPDDVQEASWALVQQGLLLVQAGRIDEALEVYERVLALLDGTEDFGLRVRRAVALWNSTEAYGRTDRIEEAIAANEQLAAEIADDTAAIFAAMTEELAPRDDPQARIMRVGIVMKEASIHATLGRFETAEELLRTLIERHGDDELPDIRRMVAMAREQIDADDVL